MATVHLARAGSHAHGGSRTVAVKLLAARTAERAELAPVLVDEARMAMRIQHRNVVPLRDVVDEGGEIALVMDYVVGPSLAALVRAAREERKPMPAPIASAIVCDVLAGLQAAHDATDLHGAPLDLVHRDVSPSNVLVGTDGVARVIDFGIAKARGRIQAATRVGEIKGKLAYMAPEQIERARMSPRTDVYATGVVLWELVARRRLFAGDEASILSQILVGMVEPATNHATDLGPEVDEVIERAMALAPEDRFASSREMAAALAAVIPPASPTAVGDWVADVARRELEERAALVAAIEQHDVDRAWSNATEASNADSRPSRERRAVTPSVLGLGGAAVLACVAGLFAMHRSDRPAIVTPSSSTPPPVASTEPQPPLAAEPAAESVPAAVTSAPGEPTHHPRRPRPPTTNHATSVDCSIPYTLDAQRRRVYKRECL
ncbi:serine/threonine protein kinase [Labilithrix luteola]|uniref:Serine/threonine protein kinase n=2 Tax=Labilithrix luteola TaxID=1391654 RepID=A0A0K1PKL6_9BACT|nr:serine/threonine protein kinase [Labilithrix luteola]